MQKVDYTALQNEELSGLAAGGEEAALETLYARFREMIRIKSNLYFIVGGDKEDLIQEGMIGLFRAIMEYNPKRSTAFATFAELCVERQMMTAIKAADRLKHTPLNRSVSISESNETINDGEGSGIEDILSDRYALSLEDEVLLRDQIEEIDRNSTEIFSKLEKIVWEEFKCGKTYTEIAGSLGRSPKTIDNAIQRMKKKVEKHMEMY